MCRGADTPLPWSSGGCSSVVECELPKLEARVRFPSPAPRLANSPETPFFRCFRAAPPKPSPPPTLGHRLLRSGKRSRSDKLDTTAPIHPHSEPGRTLRQREPARTNLHLRSISLDMPTRRHATGGGTSESGPHESEMSLRGVRLIPCISPLIPSAWVNFPGPEHNSACRFLPLRRLICLRPLIGDKARIRTNPSPLLPLTTKLSIQ